MNLLRSPYLSPEHLEWQDTLRRWVAREITPFVNDWDEAGEFPRDLYRRAAEIGLLGLGYPEEYGGIPADRFASPFPNEKAARAANGGAYPPDLSLIVKARPDGANYVRALLIGYTEPPADFNLMPGMNYNAYFPGHQIAMAQPLYGDDVTYEDGTPSTIEQEAEDLTTFLAWASEPEMEERKRAGVMTLLFLLIFTGLLYATKRKIWADVH